MRLEVGEVFEIANAKERVIVLQIAQVLRQAGMIKFRVKTWRGADGRFRGLATD